MADQVFAGAPSEKAYVFRRDFQKKKWENVATENKTSKVHFLKRSGKYFFRVIPDDKKTARFERELSKDNDIHNSGNGFLQVPLTDRKELYGIRFKNHDDSLSFYARIVNEMGIPMQMPTISGAVAGPPYSDQTLPAPIIADTQPMTIAGPVIPQAWTPPPQPRPQAQPLTQAQPSPQVQYPLVKPPLVFQHSPSSEYDWSPHMQKPDPSYHQEPPLAQQPAYHQDPPHRQQPAYHQNPPFREQPAFHQDPPLRPQPAYHQNPPLREQPAYQQNPPLREQPAYHQEPPLAQPLNYPHFQPHRPSYQQPSVEPPPPMLRPPTGLPLKPKPAIVTPPIQRRMQQPQPSAPPPPDINSMTAFLTNAINGGNIEAAKSMIEILATLPPDRRKFSVTYDDSLEPVKEEPNFTLDIQIEFQQPTKHPLPVFLDVKESYTLYLLQQMVESNFHIPRAAQNWIIGPKLVKNAADLQRTLRDYEITGAAGKARVYLYVMHVKKANVPKEEVEYIRQRQRSVMSQQQPHPQHPPQMAQPGAMGQMGVERGMAPTGMQPRDQQPYMAIDEPIYNRLDSRGYDPIQQQCHQPAAAAPHQQQHFPQQYAGQQPNMEPLYGQLNTQQTRMPYPAHDSTMRGVGPQQDWSPPFRAQGPEQTFQVERSPLSPQMFMGVPNQHEWDRPQEQPPAPPPQPPPRPPQEEKKKEKVGWVCVGCTFINKPRRPGCEQCGTARPEDFVIPEDCPLDDDELRILREQEESEKLFRQYAEEEKVREQQQAQENYHALVQAEEAAFVTNDEKFDCAICFTEIEVGEGVILRGCLHEFCQDCVHSAIIHCQEAEVKCPFKDDKYSCDATISEREIRGIVTPEELEALYRRGLRQAENAAGNSFHCRSANCEGFCFYEDEVNEFDCPLCKKRNCLLCKAIHEGMNCQEYQEDLKRRAENDAAAKATQDMLEDLVRNGEAMDCPSCKIIVQKKDGCDWIRCSMCKTEICWATKGPRWGPKGRNDTSGGCKCRVGGKKCHPHCRNCH